MYMPQILGDDLINVVPFRSKCGTLKSSHCIMVFSGNRKCKSMSSGNIEVYGDDPHQLTKKRQKPKQGILSKQVSFFISSFLINPIMYNFRRYNNDIEF